MAPETKSSGHAWRGMESEGYIPCAQGQLSGPGAGDTLHKEYIAIHPWIYYDLKKKDL